MSRVLVVSSCTGKKALKPPHQLRLEDFGDSHRLARRESELTDFMLPAGQMYTGQQHVKMMSGLSHLHRRWGPESASLAIVSAGYGLIPEEQVIAPYEATFNSMSRSEARAWGKKLGIPTDVRRGLAGHPLVVFLLGERYLDAVDPPLRPGPSGRLVFLTTPALCDKLRAEGVTTVPAGLPETKRWGGGLVALKGQMFRLFALGLARLGESAFTEIMADDTKTSFERAMEAGRRGE